MAQRRSAIFRFSRLQCRHAGGDSSVEVNAEKVAMGIPKMRRNTQRRMEAKIDAH